MKLAPVLVPLLLAPLISAHTTVPQADPLTGIWEGRGKGDSAVIPPEGFGFSLRLEARGEKEPLATLTMEGVPSTAPVAASFDADNGELSFRCDLLGVLVDIELELDGEELTGKATGLGITAALTGKRTSRELPALAPKSGPRVRVDLTTLGPDAWHEDLLALAELLPQKHKNAFHTLSKEEWQRRVHVLDARLAQLSPAASALALAQLVAAVGDAHTELALAGNPFDRFLPLQLTWFEDGLFVTAVDERFEPVLGTRLKRIGKASVEEAAAAVRTIFAAENESWPRVKVPGLLAQPGLLAALGVTADAAAIPLVVEGAGGEDVALTIDGAGSGKWLVAPDPALVAPPLGRQRTGEAYWFAPIEERRALYFAFNRCAEDPAHPMASFMRELFGALERSGAERLVIDLRHNSGGNSAVLGQFVPALAAHARLAAPGALRVLIGASTYSSGMMNAYQLRDGARARLYGEPTGGKPNSYGEVRVFTLPRSGLEVYHSTNYFRDVPGDPPAVAPDVAVATSSADFFAGVDPVLERALAAD